MAITRRQIKDVEFKDFDPNNFTQADEVWALYDGTTFRTMGARPSALNAFMAARSAKLYWMEPNGQWRAVAVRYGHYQPDKKCEWCTGDVVGWGSHWCWEKQSGKIPPGPDGVNLLFLCDTCKRLNG